MRTRTMYSYSPYTTRTRTSGEHEEVVVASLYERRRHGRCDVLALVINHHNASRLVLLLVMVKKTGVVLTTYM